MGNMYATAMNVIPLTVFVGLMLVVFFIFLFLYTGSCSAQTGPDRDSLIPFDDENVRPAGLDSPKTSPHSFEN